MQFPIPSSQSWAESLSLVLYGAVGTGGLIGILRLISYRKKPKSEIAKIDAETENARINGVIKASDQLVRLMDKINLMEAQMDQREKEIRETTKFYRGQVQYFEELDLAYRNRSHAMNGELGRLVLAIRQLEATCTEKTGETVHPFPIRTYDEIVRPFPLPNPPE